MRFLRTDANHQDFNFLVEKLDSYLSVINGETDSFFKSLNHSSHLHHVLLIYSSKGIAMGCGALKIHNEKTVEIKRMFVDYDFRRKGIAQKLLLSLEDWAKELGFSKCILETSVAMKPAVSLYKNNGYLETEKYGVYKEVPTSICFSKNLGFH